MDYRDNRKNTASHHPRWAAFTPPRWSNFAPPLTGGSDSVTLLGIDMNDLHQDDFIF